MQSFNASKWNTVHSLREIWMLYFPANVSSKLEIKIREDSLGKSVYIYYKEILFIDKKLNKENI